MSLVGTSCESTIKAEDLINQNIQIITNIMFKSAILASVCSLTTTWAATLSAEAGSHKKYRPHNPGPQLIVVDGGYQHPPPPPPAPEPKPRQTIIRREVQVPQYYNAGY